MPLNARADLSVSNTLRTVRSKNVVARLEGSDPKLRDECVIYTAHWDHLGRDPALKGDQIFNGAADNASGTAALLEIARAFTKVDPAPRRSVVFLAVTAEEKGLLGAKYYASHPLYPLEKTLANLNMDVINLWGKTRDVVNLGLGQTTLDGLVADVAGAQGRRVVPDAEPEKGLFYRSDHFAFVKQGVPAVDARGGVDYVGKPADFGLKKRAEYTKNDYHKVSDEVKPGWDLSGALEDLRLLTEVGYRVAQGPTYPEWLPGTEFRARRGRRRSPRRRRCGRETGDEPTRLSSRPVSCSQRSRRLRAGWISASAGSSRRSTPSPTCSTRSPCWRKFAGRRSSRSSGAISPCWPACRRWA